MGIGKWTIYDRYVMEWINVKCNGWWLRIYERGRWISIGTAKLNRFMLEFLLLLFNFLTFLEIKVILK
jgi:hypothetical protein